MLARNTSLAESFCNRAQLQRVMRAGWKGQNCWGLSSGRLLPTYLDWPFFDREDIASIFVLEDALHAGPESIRTMHRHHHARSSLLLVTADDAPCSPAVNCLLRFYRIGRRRRSRQALRCCRCSNGGNDGSGRRKYEQTTFR